MQRRIDLTERQAVAALWTLIGGYATFFSVICFLKFDSFSYNDFDLAIYSQVLWNILRGSIFNSIFGIDFLGNHMHLILFLVAPVYKIFPHPFTLLFLQSLALGISAYPLYLLARSFLGYKWALVVSFMYLAYPALGYVNLFEFHTTVFATAFIFFMLYYFYKNKFGLFFLFAALAMLCQENIALAVIMMGVYSLLKRKGLKWGILPIAVGGVYFWLAAVKLMPYFNKNTVQYINIYRHLGNSFPNIIGNILTHPFEILFIMFTEHKIIYLIQLFGPLSFIPLLSPLSLLPALPFFMQHLLSLRMAEATIYVHYTAEIIPFIFLALIFGLGNLLKVGVFKRFQFILGAFLLAVYFPFSLFLGPYLTAINQAGSVFKKDQIDRQKEIFLKEIPSDAAVIATFEFLPRLAHRKDLYSFHHLYSGLCTLSNKPYNVPQNIRFALVDFNDKLTFRDFYTPGGYQNIQKLLSSHKWGVVGVKDTVVLLEKDKADKFPLYSVLSSAPIPQYKTFLKIDQAIELLGYDFIEQKDGFLRLKFYWRSLDKTEKDINIFFDVLDHKGALIYRSFGPICYRIFPTQAWQPGQLIAEEKNMFFPFTGKYFLKIGFYNYISGEIIQAGLDIPLAGA